MSSEQRLSLRERRAAALEAIANALLELAAIEREPKEPGSEASSGPRKAERKPQKPRATKAAKTRAARGTDDFLGAINARFVKLVGRSMSDDELYDANIWTQVARESGVTPSADEIAGRVKSTIGLEPPHYAEWRRLGLDPKEMERVAQERRQKLHETDPEMGWRNRVDAVWEVWNAITEPLSDARRKARMANRAAKKAERAKLGRLGLKS